MRLPEAPYADGIGKRGQLQFYGLDHNLGAADGGLWDMRNLTSDYYPLLATRPKRKKTRKLTSGGGLFAWDALAWVDGTGFYYGGAKKGDVTAGETLCRHRRLHHHSAGQEILQHRFRRVRQLREHMERAEPDLYEREALRRGGGGEHDPLRECQMGGLLQARRRGDDLRLHEAYGEQQNARHSRDRRGQAVLL